MNHATPPRRAAVRRLLLAVAGTLTALLPVARPGMAAVPAVGAVDRPGTDAGAFLRVETEPGRSIALEIASRRYVQADGDGPEVRLVGVAHIGEADYYRALQELLAGHDVVLYESVKPAGTGGAGGDTDGERVASTRAALDFVATLVEGHRVETGRYPADLDEVRKTVVVTEPRLARFVDAALVDAWDRPMVYSVERGDEASETYRLVSYGADGRAGGRGIDADLVATPPEAPVVGGSADDRLQVQLAEALDLSFQLDALDYGDARWRCSDLSIDQIERAMVARGSDFSVVEGTLAGSTLPARIVRFLLGVVRMADTFTGGAVSDLLKVLMIEMLGDQSFVEESLVQFDPAFAEVIIGDRNQVVIDDLRELTRREQDVRSVAVLYGAGHMPDLDRRLREELGYERAGRQWFRAIEVDLDESAVSERDVRQLRMMVRRMMRAGVRP